jgi:hypothetical protein
MLFVPPHGLRSIQTHVTATNNETATFSISVTAHASTNTKGSYTELIAATTYESFGVMVQLAGLQTTASTNQRCLVDISIGAAGSELVLIPDLTCGNVADYAAASSGAVYYYFPIYVPAGVRVSARCQASTGGDIVNVAVRLFQNLTGTQWVGSRVTAYGVDAANSRGTSHTPSQNSYNTATELTSSTTNPIRYMQLGFDLLSDTTGATSSHLVRIGYTATPIYVASELPVKESTTIEAVMFTDANFILSQMRFNIPAAQSLRISAMRSAATPEARGWIVYGVD